MPFNLGHDVELERNNAIKRIDTAAGDVRAYFVSPGMLTDMEYQQTQRAVEKWRGNGSPADNVPNEILTGAKYDGLSVEDEAQKIEKMAARMEAITDAIRTVRLDAKGKVWAASGQSNEQKLIAQAVKAADEKYEQIKKDHSDK